MEDNKTRTRYQDNGCSFVVEVQPSYQNEGAEASKGSTDDVDQQALVHREEIAEDRTSGTFRYDSNKGEREGGKNGFVFFTPKTPQQVSKTRGCSGARTQDCRSRISPSLAKARSIPAIVTGIRWSTTPATWVTLCTGVVTSRTRYPGSWRVAPSGWNSTSRRTPRRRCCRNRAASRQRGTARRA